MKRPSKREMAAKLLVNGWTPSRVGHEPTFWADPLGLLGHRERTEGAFALLERRLANGIGAKR